MESYFFTCGQIHCHVVSPGVIWDKDSVLQINAESEDAARAKVFSMFGDQWAACYTSEDISIEYYKNGICDIFEA